MPVNRYGVIVGVTDYSAVDGVDDLRYSGNDAIRLYNVLLKHGDFKPENLHLFCDVDPEGQSAQAPHYSDILSTLDTIAEKATEEDLIIFYFAGHGIEIQKSPYLLTNEARMNVVDRTALHVESVNSILNKSAAGCVIRLFDACRAPYGNLRFISPRMGTSLQAALLQSGEGTATFSACSSSEFAHETPEFDHGVFSYYLCEGLEGAASNDEGIVTLTQLQGYVQISVDNWCREQSASQTPQFAGDFTRVPHLTRIAKPQHTVVDAVPNNPLGQLLVALQEQTRATPEFVKKMRFTTDEEGEEVQRLVYEVISSEFKQLEGQWSQVGLDINTELRDAIRQQERQLFNKLTIQITNARMPSEFVAADSALLVEIFSKTAIIPSTKVSVAVVRFTFVYWVWYSYECRSPGKFPQWAPDPPTIQGFFLLHPEAAIQPITVKAEVIDELLSRIGDALTSWSGQLQEYVTARVTKVIESGSIIT